MDPVEHRTFQQARLILTAEPLKAFFLVFQCPNLEKEVAAGQNKLGFNEFATPLRCIRRRGLLCGSAPACPASFIPAERAPQTRDGTRTRGRAGLRSTGVASL